ncbi:class A beta-lactamase [Microbispora sp. RL4-1S]|uniref:Class A beta-lactamase n=1 Tax=Microbispora oryzae TaxID=2806554 RepID=A0A940WG78_9ACTN|nr:class A beta-lactamase [Microbispora oryzae]MBP2704941.1 class A beta-lactamase [Microbispora oryzae]
MEDSTRIRAALGAAGLAVSAVFAVTGLAGCGETTTAGRAAPKSITTPIRTPEPSADPSQAEVDRRLRRLEQQDHGRIGAYAIDTGTGRVVSHRARELFPTLSTFKAMLSAAVLRKARQSDPGLLDRVVRYGRGDLLDYSPITEKHVATGMTVAELCQAAITMSDNTAGNLLLKQIGGPAGLTAFYRSLGDSVSRLDRWEPELNVWKPGERRDTTSPYAFARDLRALALGDALEPADRNRLIGWMADTRTGDARIRAGLPKDWTVADKTGTGPAYGTTNDVAVVRPPSGAPVVMVILTNRRAADGASDEKVVAKTAAILARGLGRAG